MATDFDLMPDLSKHARATKIDKYLSIEYYREEDIKQFIKMVKKKITEGCMGTSANCYKIKKEVDRLSGNKLISQSVQEAKK